MERLSDIGTIKKVLQKHGFRFSKAMGQNFLVNPSVCPRMAEACGAGPESGVLEIGPGIGVLTCELAKRAKKVVAVELDERLRSVLEETLESYPPVTIVYGDVLKVDLKGLFQREFFGMPVCVCANLPYYITSPVLMRLLEERLPIDWITVMVQKEAAARICALPGTRESGALSLAVRYYAEPEVLFQVSRGSFLPAPNVDSTVIRLRVRRAPAVGVVNETAFFRLIQAAFQQRRKMLGNAVSAGLHLPKEQVHAAMERAGVAPQARAEALTLEQFARLSDELVQS
jgi:16S rRNA (adenine1518-N6/adenine1519-N6)-dimethyltransferase